MTSELSFDIDRFRTGNSQRPVSSRIDNLKVSQTNAICIIEVEGAKIY